MDVFKKVSPANSGIFVPVLFSIVLLLQASGQANATSYNAEELLSLERNVWEASANQLGQLEIKVARIVQDRPTSIFGHYLLAQLYLRLFSENPSELLLLKQASDLAQQAVELAPNVEFGYIALANVLDFMGHSDKGIEVLTSGQSRGMKPSWRTPFTTARLQADTQSAEQILTHLDRAITGCHKQSSIIAPYIVATLQTTLADKEYEKELRRWNALCPNHYFQITLADTLAKLNQFDEAHQLYDRIILEDPTFASASINDAILLYRKLGKSDDAEKKLLLVLKNPENVESSQLVLAKIHLGNIMIAQKNFGSAEQQFIEAAFLAQDRTKIIENAAKAYRENGEFQRLVAFLNKFSTEVGGSGLVFALRGEVLSESLAKHQDAVRSFSDAILLEPERVDFYNGMGLALYRGNDLESSLKLFQTALKLDENDAIARYNEACVLVRMGSTAEGLTSLQKAIASDEKLRDSARKDNDFASVRDNREFRKILTDGVEMKTDGPASVDDSESLFGH